MRKYNLRRKESKESDGTERINRTRGAKRYVLLKEV